mmetsp:Transcript_7199/g.26468  ORF Transcript_7199/g.26468 Transcript_7199/m.26468 type:complete len:279 (-) Transcript_7199:1291-2127(-)|eukprot:scaffold382_cov380-Prasinococcus_capsulatus_cf.AAC.11
MGPFNYNEFLDDAVVPSEFESQANDFFSFDIFNADDTCANNSLYMDGPSASIFASTTTKTKPVNDPFTSNVFQNPPPQIQPSSRAPAMAPPMPTTSIFVPHTPQTQGMLRLNYNDVMEAVGGSKKREAKSPSKAQSKKSAAASRSPKAAQSMSDKVTTQHQDSGNDTLSSGSDATQAVRVPGTGDKPDAQKASTGSSAEEGETMNRADRVARYRQKRKTRTFTVKVRYQIRKLNAERRPRLKGRFVKAEELQQMSQAQVARLMEPHYPASFMDSMPYV